MKNRIERLLVGIAAAAVCLTFGSAAQARYLGGSFDPFGFAGDVIWRIGDGCDTTTVGWHPANALNPSCSFQLHRLVVDVWTSESPPGVPVPNSLIELTFADCPIDVDCYPNQNVVAGYYVDNFGNSGNLIAGFDTFLIGPQYGNSIDNSLDNQFGVQFTSGHSPAVGTPLAWLFPPDYLAQNGVYLWEDEVSGLPMGRGCSDPSGKWAFFLCADQLAVNLSNDPSSGRGVFITSVDNPSGLRFLSLAAVPEPGSLALILGALGAGWLTRRRKAAV